MANGQGAYLACETLGSILSTAKLSQHITRTQNLRDNSEASSSDDAGQGKHCPQGGRSKSLDLKWPWPCPGTVCDGYKEEHHVLLELHKGALWEMSLLLVPQIL